MTVNHDPSVLRLLPARLDHRPHFDQPRACDQISNRDHHIKPNMNQERCCEHDVDHVPVFQTSIQRADYDRLHTTLNLTRLRPDRNAIADRPNHRHQLRARSRSTR